MLAGELFGPLRDPELFAQVSLDQEVHTIVWPTAADFGPATRHDWPEHESASEQPPNAGAAVMRGPNRIKISLRRIPVVPWTCSS